MGQSKKRWGVAVAGPCAAALAMLLVGQASAQTRDETHKEPMRATNACNGEEVVGEGQVHSITKTRPGPNSSTHTTIQLWENGQGVGTLGNQYSFGQQQRFDLRSSNEFSSATFRTRQRVVSNGPAPNFFMTVAETFTDSGVQTRFEQPTGCKG
jgi:hypothetical protein